MADERERLSPEGLKERLNAPIAQPWHTSFSITMIHIRDWIVGNRFIQSSFRKKKHRSICLKAEPQIIFFRKFLANFDPQQNITNTPVLNPLVDENLLH